MAEIVIDASLALHAIMAGHEYNAQARRFLSDNAAVRLIAPPLFESEADSNLRRMISALKIPTPAAEALVTLLDALPLKIIHDGATRQRAREIGDRAKLDKVYDCTYAALADLRGVELWTADKRFYHSVSGALPFVKFIGNY
jgi:predicted nucleic acid-binding protein